MSIPKPEIGLTINYSYLWKSEAEKGLEEGSKNRPCVISDVNNKPDGTVVTVHPITHSPPGKVSDGVEIPQVTKSRLGLDDQRSWIVTNECNQFEWPGPDLSTVSRNSPGTYSYGFMPEKITSKVIEQAQTHALGPSVVNRDEAVSQDSAEKAR